MGNVLSGFPLRHSSLFRRASQKVSQNGAGCLWRHHHNIYHYTRCSRLEGIFEDIVEKRFSNFEWASELPGRLVKTQIAVFLIK